MSLILHKHSSENFVVLYYEVFDSHFEELSGAIVSQALFLMESQRRPMPRSCFLL